MTSNPHSTLRYRTGLTVGFLALTAALVAAYRRPATGYELSIYASTPIAFWIGIAVALLAAIAVVVSAPRGSSTKLGLGLATMSVLSIVGLPVLRSYTYYGSGDSLTHLGWAREIRDGRLSPLEFLYPANHLVANFMVDLAGVELTRGLVMLPTIIFPLVSVVFFGYCLKTLSDSHWAFPIGVFAGLLFIPINKVSVHVVAHPSSQAILYVALPLYLLVRYLTTDADGGPLTSSYGLLLAVGSVGMILVHPQETMSYLVVLGSVLGVQLVASRYAPTHPIASHRSVAPHVVVVAVGFFAWTSRIERAQQRASYVVESFLGRTGETLSEATTRSASLAQLGGSVEELFVKLFVVSLLFCLLAAAVTLYAYRGRFRAVLPSDPIVAYFAAALVPLTIGFFVIFFADQGDHYFRFMGFMMVPVTILGAIGLAKLVSDAERRMPQYQLSAVVGTLLVVLLVLQLATIHMSPYIYQGNQQVTDQSMEGHVLAFEHHDGETPITGLRRGSHRYVHAEYGFTAARGDLNFPGYREGIPDTVFAENLTTHYTRDRYVVLTHSDYVVEVELYQELRYADAGFQQFETEPEINRIQDNGEFRLYRMTAN